MIYESKCIQIFLILSGKWFMQFFDNVENVSLNIERRIKLVVVIKNNFPKPLEFWLLLLSMTNAKSSEVRF